MALRLENLMLRALLSRRIVLMVADGKIVGGMCADAEGGDLLGRMIGRPWGGKEGPTLKIRAR